MKKIDTDKVQAEYKVAKMEAELKRLQAERKAYVALHMPRRVDDIPHDLVPEFLSGYWSWQSMKETHDSERRELIEEINVLQNALEQALLQWNGHLEETELIGRGHDDFQQECKLHDELEKVLDTVRKKAYERE